MIKVSVFIVFFLIISFVRSEKDWSGDKVPKKWLDDGQKNIERILNRKLNGNLAKNVILFLGDGMGITTVTGGRILKGQKKGNNGEEEITVMESLDHVGLSKTYNIDAQTADSAGTATAYLTGVKSRIGYIGIDGSAYDCKTSLKAKLDSILKWAYHAGKSTGIVTTARVTHATPAAAYASVPDRDWESYDGINFREANAKDGCKDIAAQLVDENGYINLVMGGGWSKFLANSSKSKNPAYPGNGDRIDGRDLIKDWEEKGTNYKFIYNKKDFESLKPNLEQHILALFSAEHMSYEIERDKSVQPSIIEMTEKAIELLSINPRGYFLLVEGGKIDHGHHESHAQKSLEDFVVFDEAINKGLKITKQDDTLITVTADHSHVFTLGGYANRGNDLFGLNYDKYGSLSGSNLTFTSLLYGNGPGFQETIRNFNLTDNQTKDKNYRQESAVYMQSETHGGEDVPIYARGPMAYLFDGTFEQSYIAHVMAYSACIGPYNSSKCREDRGVLVTKSSSEIIKPISIYLAFSFVVHFYNYF